MPKSSGPVVGISFSENAIHVVVLRSGSGGEMQATQVGSAPLPEDAIQNGMVYETVLLSAAIRALLSQLGITTRDAVLGLPSQAVITRSIPIPPVPERERRALVAGEIDHLNVLPPGQVAFDFVPLAKTEIAASRGEPVLFFAAERAVIESYRTTAREAGLRLLGLEPSDFAAIRTVYPALAEEPFAVVVSLGAYHTDLLFLRQGQATYSRRLDTGIAQISQAEAFSPTGSTSSWTMVDAGEATTGIGGMDALIGSPLGQSPDLGSTGSETLVTEIERSLEYYQRTYGVAAEDLDAARLILLPNDPDLGGLPAYAAAALERDVPVVFPFENIQLGNDDLPDDLAREGGIAYVPALGLALGPLEGRFAGAPRFNLGVEEVHVVRARQVPRLLAASLGASAGLFLIGGLSAVLLAQKHGPIRQDLVVAKRDMAVVSQQEQMLSAERQRQRELVQKVRSENVSWTGVLRYLAQAIPRGVGLTNVTTQGGMLLASGETTDARTVSTVLGMLNASPFFAGATLNSISSSADNGKVAFQINILLPPSAPAGAAATGASDTLPVNR